MSVPDAVGIALERWVRDKQGVQQDLLAGGAAAAPSAPQATEPVKVSAPAPVSGSGSGNYGDQAAQQMMFGYDNSQAFIGTCPDCGSQMEYAEGCVKCHVCGFSECG
jgi:ribonucleoside-diphosphate reductase alpha chain